MPNRKKTQLLEFCYPGDRVIMSPGFCFVLAANGFITNDDTDCTNFVNESCIMSYDVANEMYKYPGCLKINPIKGCYTSDPECLSVPDVVDSTSASETTTIEVPRSSQVTNYSIQELPAEEENGDTTTIIVIAVIIPLVVIIGILVVGIIYKRKKCCFKKGYSFEEIPLLERNTIGNVEILDSGHSIKFSVQSAKTSLTNGLHSIEWKKDGTFLQVDNLKYSGGDQREPSLIIQNVSLEDAGNYQCEITLDDGTVYSEAFLISTGEVEILNSESLKLCITGTVLANGPHSVEWKKDGTSLQMHNSKYLGGDESKPSLDIQTVYKEDAGIYQCLITSHDKTWNIHLFFIDLPAVEFIGTEVRESSLVLKCEVAYSSVRSSILWKRDNQIITEDEKFSGVDTACLIIKDFNITDSGLYQCTLSNDLGWSADCQYQFETAKICLTEASPLLPFICKKYKNIKLKARFERKNGYIPLEHLTVQWQKVQREGENNLVSAIHIDNAKYTLQYSQVDENGKMCELVIHQATMADSGVYCCVLLDGANGQLESEKLEVFVVEDFYNTEEWKNDDCIYEEPEEGFCTRIIQLLHKTNAVTLVGPPGVGKTFTARHIALKMKEVENGWNICQISNMEELLIEDKLPNSVQRLIIFDHPFGKTSVNILNLVYFLLHKNNFCQLEGKTKVIMTCRSNIFEEIIAFPIDVLKNVIYMTKTYLGKSPGLLKEINEAVNVQSGLTQNDDDGENEYLPRLCNHIGAYFSESQNHVYDFYTLILLARQENLILKKSLLNAQKNISQVLEINIPEKTFSEGIKSAIKKSKYLRRKRIGDNTVCFCEQECILDAFICHLLKKDPQLFLKCAGNKVICSHVCPFSASDGECWRLPDTEQFQTLSKRLHEYLTSDDMCSMSNVIKVPYWKNDEFINVFIDVLSQDRMTDILYCSKRYPIFNGRRNSVVNDNSNKTNEQCAYIWNETELLRF
ncbi:uncharacterized protein LOC134243733 [Saccostrea cucullata]|uniref:uncharacterized protein LOC134243733 n=1 Tax=Saccostrea cuccullata TaxID=36930 RepID=UPI002ED5ED99